MRTCNRNGAAPHMLNCIFNTMVIIHTSKHEAGDTVQGNEIVAEFQASISFPQAVYTRVAYMRSDHRLRYCP